MNASFQTQFVQNIGNRSLHILDRIYLGGHQNVRGFKLNSIGPRTEDCALGGAFSMAMATHLFYPLYPKEVVSFLIEFSFKPIFFSFLLTRLLQPDQLYQFGHAIGWKMLGILLDVVSALD